MTSSSTLDPDSTPGGQAGRPKGHDPGTRMDHPGQDATDADPDGSGERDEAMSDESIAGARSTIDRGPDVR